MLLPKIPENGQFLRFRLFYDPHKYEKKQVCVRKYLKIDSFSDTGHFMMPWPPLNVRNKVLVQLA